MPYEYYLNNFNLSNKLMFDFINFSRKEIYSYCTNGRTQQWGITWAKTWEHSSQQGDPKTASIIKASRREEHELELALPTELPFKIKQKIFITVKVFTTFLEMEQGTEEGIVVSDAVYKPEGSFPSSRMLPKLHIVTYTCDPNTCKTEAGGSRFWSQPGLLMKNLSRRKKNMMMEEKGGKWPSFSKVSTSPVSKGFVFVPSKDILHWECWHLLIHLWISLIHILRSQFFHLRIMCKDNSGSLHNGFKEPINPLVMPNHVIIKNFIYALVSLF